MLLACQEKLVLLEQTRASRQRRSPSLEYLRRILVTMFLVRMDMRFSFPHLVLDVVLAVMRLFVAGVLLFSYSRDVVVCDPPQ